MCVSQPAIMTMVQTLGTLILLWLPGTSWRPFSMFSSASLNLTCLVKHHQIWGGILSCEIKPVAREEEPRSQSWAGSRCPWCPSFSLQSRTQRFLQVLIFPHQVKPSSMNCLVLKISWQSKKWIFLHLCNNSFIKFT